MSGNLPPQPETLESVTLNGRSLQAWHDWLTTDRETELRTGSLLVPCSRYGRNGRECAWFALAAQAVVVDDLADDDPEASLEHLMGLVVNDHDDIAGLLAEHYHAVPEPLRQMIGDHADVIGLVAGPEQQDPRMTRPQELALIQLCGRFGVEFKAEDYIVYPDTSPIMPGYAEGWLGGVNTTLFVGCDRDGRISS